MSHDPEAVEAIAKALWNTEIPTWGDAVDMARRLAAAGYTVTKSDAVAAEREACAGAVDEMCDDVDDPFMYGTLRAVAAAIRNRGEAK